MTRPRNARCPENVLGWLAWYAEDGLSARQKGAVEAHAAECADCRAELDIISGAPFEIDHDLPDPDRLFQEIKARIDRVEEEGESRVIPIDRNRGCRHTDDELERLERFILDDSMDSMGEFDSHRGTDRPRFVRAAWMAAAALALLFLGGLGGALFSSSGSPFERSEGRLAAPSDAIYRSATIGDDPATTMGSAPMLDVVFQDSASAREISDALRSVGASIVAGPSSLGVYRLRIDRREAEATAPNAADVAAVAARLKNRKPAVVIFAEAVP